MATSTSVNLTDTTKTSFFTAAADGALTVNLYNAGAKLVVVNIFVGADQVAARTLIPGEDGAFFGLALAEDDVVYLQAAGDGTIDVIARAAVLYPSELGGGEADITIDNAIIEDSPNPVEGGALYTALSAKQNSLTAGTGIDITGDVISATGGGGGSSITVDSALSASSENPVQNKVIYSALQDKQNTLTAGTGIDITGSTISSTVPSITVASSITENGTNPVTGGAIYTALGGKQNTLTAGTGIDITGDVISATGGGGGGGGAGAEMIFKTEEITWSAIPSKTVATKEITITGAVSGDTVIFTTDVTANSVWLFIKGVYVSAADTITIAVANQNTSAATPATGDWEFCVIKKPAAATPAEGEGE